MTHAAIRQMVGPEVMPIGITLCLMAAAVVLFLRGGRAKPASAEGGEVGVSEPDNFEAQAPVIRGEVWR